MESLYDHVAGYLIKFIGLSDIAKLSILSKVTNKIFTKYIEVNLNKITSLSQNNPIINEYYFISRDLSLNDIIWFDYKKLKAIVRYEKIVYAIPDGYKYKLTNTSERIMIITSSKFKILYMHNMYSNRNTIILNTPNIELIYLGGDNNKIILSIALNKLKAIICDKLIIHHDNIYDSVQYLRVESSYKLDKLLIRFPNITRASISISFVDLVKYDGKIKFNHLMYLQIYFDYEGPSKINDLSNINKVLKNIRLLCPNLIKLHYVWRDDGDSGGLKLDEIFNEESFWHCKVIKYITRFGIKYETSSERWGTEYLPEKYRLK